MSTFGLLVTIYEVERRKVSELFHKSNQSFAMLWAKRYQGLRRLHRARSITRVDWGRFGTTVSPMFQNYKNRTTLGRVLPFVVRPYKALIDRMSQGRTE